MITINTVLRPLALQNFELFYFEDMIFNTNRYGRIHNNVNCSYYNYSKYLYAWSFELTCKLRYKNLHISTKISILTIAEFISIPKEIIDDDHI